MEMLPLYLHVNQKSGDDDDDGKIFNLAIFIAPACSRVRYRRPIFCPSVRQSVHPSVILSVRPSVNIYVDIRHLCQS